MCKFGNKLFSQPWATSLFCERGRHSFQPSFLGEKKRRLALPWVGISVSLPSCRPPAAHSSSFAPSRCGAELRAVGGRAGREVTPKFLPRATQDASSSPREGLGGLRERGGKVWAYAAQRTRPRGLFLCARLFPGDTTLEIPLRREKRCSKKARFAACALFLYVDFGTNFFHSHVKVHKHA